MVGCERVFLGFLMGWDGMGAWECGGGGAGEVVRVEEGVRVKGGGGERKVLTSITQQ